MDDYENTQTMHTTVTHSCCIVAPPLYLISANATTNIVYCTELSTYSDCTVLQDMPDECLDWIPLVI